LREELPNIPKKIEIHTTFLKRILLNYIVTLLLLIILLLIFNMERRVYIAIELLTLIP
jgi:hypothetical protein